MTVPSTSLVDLIDAMIPIVQEAGGHVRSADDPEFDRQRTRALDALKRYGVDLRPAAVWPLYFGLQTAVATGLTADTEEAEAVRLARIVLGEIIASGEGDDAQDAQARLLYLLDDLGGRDLHERKALAGQDRLKAEALTRVMRTITRLSEPRPPAGAPLPGPVVVPLHGDR
jgi:hypothetical protein